MIATTKKKEVIVKMMGHGKHHDCVMCKMAKSIGMIEKCTDKNCIDPSYRKENMEKEEKVGKAIAS